MHDLHGKSSLKHVKLHPVAPQKAEILQMLTSILAHIRVVVELVDEQRPLAPQRFQLSLRFHVIALSGS